MGKDLETWLRRRQSAPLSDEKTLIKIKAGAMSTDKPKRNVVALGKDTQPLQRRACFATPEGPRDTE